MKDFIPDYNNILDAAKNVKPKRMPIYEHNISPKIMEKVLNKNFSDLINGDRKDKKEFFSNYVNFFKETGYDTVTYEACIGNIMPGNGALSAHTPGVIKDRADFIKYPWNDVLNIFFEKFGENFEILREVMPKGMRTIGGPGNGIFECVQEVVGYEELCYIRADDQELYDDLFNMVGNVNYLIWEKFMKEYSDIYCVCRFGDDLGFKTAPLLPKEEIVKNIIPKYARITELVHSYNKPFLLHSCGKIFDVMDELINIAKIDAKHSNEDQIAPFSTWVEKYGDRIGNFGGVDVDVLCTKSEKEIKDYTSNVISYSIGHKGFALGSGNSIPEYVPVEGYLAMIEAARESRGE